MANINFTPLSRGWAGPNLASLTGSPAFSNLANVYMALYTNNSLFNSGVSTTYTSSFEYSGGTYSAGGYHMGLSTITLGTDVNDNPLYFGVEKSGGGVFTASWSVINGPVAGAVLYMVDTSGNKRSIAWAVMNTSFTNAPLTITMPQLIIKIPLIKS